MSSIVLNAPLNGAVVNLPLGDSSTIAVEGSFDLPDDDWHSARVEVVKDGQVVATSTDVPGRAFRATVNVASPSTPSLHAVLHVLQWVGNTHVPEGGYWKEVQSLGSEAVTISVTSAEADPGYHLRCQCIDAGGRPVQGFEIAAFDQDPRSPDDPLGASATTDVDGMAEFAFTRSSFTEHPGERFPDVYFRISNGGLDWAYELPHEHAPEGVLRNFQPRTAPVVVQLPVTTLRVFGWNIDEAAINPPHDAAAGLWKVVQEIRARSPDIVILNEINKWVGIFGDLDEVQQLALSLGYSASDTMCAFYVTHDEWPGFPPGRIADKYTAVLSRFPIQFVESIYHDDHTSTLHVAIEVNGLTHHAFSTRLNVYREAVQIESLARLTKVINAIPDGEPVVHGCDFNSGYARALGADDQPTNHQVPNHFRVFPRDTRMWNTLGGIGWDWGCPDDHLFVRGAYRVIHSERTSPAANPSGHGWVSAQLCHLPALQGLSLVDGSVFRERGSGRFFVLMGGARFEVPDQATVDRLYGGAGEATSVDDGALSQLPLWPCDGTMLKEDTDPIAYRVSGGTKRAMTLDDLVAGGGWDFIHQVHAGALTQIPTAP